MAVEYVGTVRHLRLSPRRHEVRHKVHLSFVELGAVEAGALMRRRPGVVRLRRSDYLPDRSETLLSEAVLGLVADSGLDVEQGPVYLLGNLRTFGHCFNPAAFFFLMTADGSGLQAVVAEVTNTPWGERHAYVLHTHGCAADEPMHGQMAKELHVSPFMEMDQTYYWRVTVPGSQLSISFVNEEDGRPLFRASLHLERRRLGRGGHTLASIRRPAPSLRTLVRIYGHAVRLRAKRVPLVAHP